MNWLSDVFQKGGPFFIVNTFFLAVVIGLIVERSIYFLGRGHLNAKAFLEQLRKLLSIHKSPRAPFTTGAAMVFACFRTGGRTSFPMRLKKKSCASWITSP